MATDPLVDFLQRRDSSSFAALVRGTRSVVFRAAWRVLGDRDLAEDVTQDVYLRCLNPPWACGDVRDGRALLVGTAVNLARMKVRGDVRRRRREQVAAERRDDADLADADLLAHVRHAVDALPESLRPAVELRYFGGLRLEDLARSLDVSLTTAKERLREARDLLRPRLADAQFGGLLAFVVGDRDAPGLRDPVPSPRLDAALRRLGSDGIAMSRIAARRPGRIKWITAAALIVAVGAGLWSVATGGPAQAPASGADDMAAVAGSGETATGTGDASSRRERDRVGRGAGGRGTSSDGATAESDAPEGAAVVADEGASIDLEVLVVDARGEPLRRGEVALGLAGLPSFDVIEKLARYRELLDPFSLAEANPVVIEDLAEFTSGLEIEAVASVPGHPPSAARAAFLREGERARITVRVVAASELGVSVVDDDSGAAIPDAVVLAISELERRGVDPDESPSAPEPGIGWTDASGRAVVGGLGEGPHHLEIRAPGYRAADLKDVSLDADLVVRLRALAGVATVVVEVRGPKGEPAAGQRVELNLSGQDTSRIERVAEDGICRFEDVPPGHHMLTLDVMDWSKRVIAAGAEAGEAAITEMFEARAGEAFDFRLGYLPQAAPLVVDVVDAAGVAQPGVVVQVYGPVLREAETDAAGRVTFDGLPADEYSVHVVNGTDWTIVRGLPIEAGAPGHVSALVGSTRVVGRVLRADGGAPLARCGVFVRGRASALVWTDAEGRFELDGMPPGDFELTFATGGDLITERRQIQAAEGVSIEPLAIELVQGGRVRILRAASDAISASLTDALGAEHEVMETDDGHLEFRALPLGSAMVEVLRGDTVIARHRLDVAAQKVVELDVR